MVNTLRRANIVILSIITVLVWSMNVTGQDVKEFESMPYDTLQAWLENNYSVDTSIFTLVSNIAINKSQGNPKKLGNVYSNLASWYGFHGLFHGDSTLKYSEKTVEQFEMAGDSNLLANAYRTLAIDYVNHGKLEESNVVLFKAVDLYEQLDDPIGMANIHRTIGIVASFANNYEKSIEYSLKAYPVFEKEKDYYKMAVTQLNLIEPYREVEQIQKAHQAAALCIDIVNNYVPDEFGVLARAYAYKGEVSHQEGKYSTALDEAQKSYDIASKVVGDERAASFLVGVADAQMALGNPKQALKNYEFILEHESDSENSKIILLYDNVIQCYEKLSDYESVAKYQKKNFNLERTLLEDKITNLETESFAKYESGKKDQAIEVQQLELAQKSRIQLLSYAVGALLLFFLLGVYFNYRKVSRISNQLKVKNDENELLLREIHHRVKNNLEIVSGLLELQGAQIKDVEIQKAMLESQNRVQAMGILHQKLYQGVNLGAVEMKDYFLNLSEGVLDSFDADQRVKVDLVMQTLNLDVDTAVPLGLIVNELLTNTLKYAFPDNEDGQITIKLDQVDDDHMLLQVTDNGIGIDNDLPAKGTGFGGQLIKLLARQLNGELKQYSDNGTVIQLKFKKAKVA